LNIDGLVSNIDVVVSRRWRWLLELFFKEHRVVELTWHPNDKTKHAQPLLSVLPGRRIELILAFTHCQNECKREGALAVLNIDFTCRPDLLKFKRFAA
jgi:hypothetical protein